MTAKGLRLFYGKSSQDKNRVLGEPGKPNFFSPYTPLGILFTGYGKPHRGQPEFVRLFGAVIFSY